MLPEALKLSEPLSVSPQRWVLSALPELLQPTAETDLAAGPRVPPAGAPA